MSYNDIRGPRVVGLTVASSLGEYLMRIQELGAVEGPDGELRISPEVMPILEAIHQVLAGGTVEVNVTHRGNPDIFNELNRRVQQVGKEANSINKAAGFYLTATL
ncbi:hypothetical protein [Vitiosangium sp. GDMCC 1.1324]|uniref:hypothetical protein n=1 Tax=Vitiosangium sp. (strain GDMCC 1.1324) TaxID=2138576 RepID=UPI000D391E57|nr:hypothetical protein [Vitiosangium sp. GDMCC 1.1324]PTL84988.1 hypothetical protein DAT35_08055 [Vitiosangium sp. GDMCC 1.1324]